MMRRSLRTPAAIGAIQARPRDGAMFVAPSLDGILRHSVPNRPKSDKTMADHINYNTIYIKVNTFRKILHVMEMITNASRQGHRADGHDAH